MAEKIKLEPRMVRFEPVALMLRLRVKLRTGLRTYTLWKDELSAPGRWMMLLVNSLM